MARISLLQAGKKCWKISTEEKNWLDAALSCGAENSVLASIAKEEEQDKVHYCNNDNIYCFTMLQMNAMLEDYDGAWIGLSDILADGTFQWLDGSDLGFTNWR